MNDNDKQQLARLKALESNEKNKKHYCPVKNGNWSLK